VGNSRGARKLARTPTLIKKKNNMEHIVICPLHATSMPINQNHNKDGYPGTQKEGHEQVCFWRSRGDGLLSFSCLMG
jgi:hypothetical protein